MLGLTQVVGGANLVHAAVPRADLDGVRTFPLQRNVIQMRRTVQMPAPEVRPELNVNCASAGASVAGAAFGRILGTVATL